MKKIFNKYDIPILMSLILLPFLSIVCIPYYVYINGIVWQEIVMLLIGWFLTGTGITVGYHRLFAHKTFKTYSVIEWFYMILGSAALQNTIINWCSDHRRHHKKLDTEEDPYSITKGFMHAHIGWVVKKSLRTIENISDLEKKSSVKFQKKYYWIIAITLSFIFPTLLGTLYGRPFGGLLWGGILRVTLVHHFTFFINSFCHYIGKRNYDIGTSARDSGMMAFLTFGEGYHNFHHKFQWDYRNGIKWYNFDPSKWIINFLSLVNFAYALRKAPDHKIIFAKIETIDKKIKNLSNYNINAPYVKNVKDIINKTSKNIYFLKSIEIKHQISKRNKISKKQILSLLKKKREYERKLEKSFSILLIIFNNIKQKNNLGGIY